MGVFTKNYRVSISDADRLGRLRMSSLFRMLQEVATEHAAGLGLGTDETRERGVLWVVTAQRCRIHRMPAYQEELVVSTCTRLLGPDRVCISHDGQTVNFAEPLNRHTMPTVKL